MKRFGCTNSCILSALALSARASVIAIAVIVTVVKAE